MKRKIGEGMIRQLSVTGTPRRASAAAAAADDDDDSTYFIGTNPLVTRLACRLLLYETDDSTFAEYANIRNGRTLSAMASKSPACDDNALKHMLDILPSLQVVRIPNSAHSIHGSQRDAFAKALVEFFTATQ